MERHIFLSVLVFTMIATAVGVFVTPGRQPERVYLPWQVERTESGTHRVFGLELGKSTLAEAQQHFGEESEVSLFLAPDGKRMIEAYFDNVDLGGLRARIVLVMAVSEAELEAIFNRGLRIANMGEGKRKVTLADEDMQRVAAMPIGSITYIPRINLDAELVSKRFGEPAQRFAEVGGKVEHWLYPDKGLDIALDSEGKEVLQYVQPQNFEALRQPLEQMQGSKEQ